MQRIQGNLQDLAKDFIHDKDGGKDKALKYYMFIA